MPNRVVEIEAADEALTTVEMHLDVEVRVAASMDEHEVAALVLEALEEEASLTVEFACTAVQ